MNVNELRTKLTNVEISFEEVKDQIAFSNAEVRFDKLPIKDIAYEKGIVYLRAFRIPKKKEVN